jgi:deoxyribonuclease IV
MKLGSHVGLGSPDMYLGSVNEALSYQADVFMVYTGAPQNTRRKKIDELNIEAALQKMNEHGIDPKDIVVHAPYIMNLANPSLETRSFGIDFLSEEIRRTAAMGATQIVLHPGAHVGQGKDIAIAFIIEGLNQVIENTQGLNVQIALETMAGKGTEIGRSFDELAAIIQGIKDLSRISVCLDTCHIHDAGYDVKDDLEGVLEQFDQAVGLNYIKVVHVNDSLNVKGAMKDRHANFGFGEIGFEALLKVIEHPVFKALPKILETPYVTASQDDTKRVYPPYLEEIAMIKQRTFNPNLLNEIRAKHE